MKLRKLLQQAEKTNEKSQEQVSLLLTVDLPVYGVSVANLNVAADSRVWGLFLPKCLLCVHVCCLCHRPLDCRTCTTNHRKRRLL